MKRKLGYILIIFFSFILNVKANYTLPNSPKVHTFGGLSNSQYIISNSVSAYCMSPNKPHGTTYKVVETVDPSKNEYHLALALAYTRFVNDGRITKNSQSGGVISATFRLISEYNNQLDHNAAKNADGSAYAGGRNDDDYHLKGKSTNLKNGDQWYGSEAKYAYGVFVDTINTINNTPGNTAAQKYAYLQNTGVLYKKANITFYPHVVKIVYKPNSTNPTKRKVRFSISSNSIGNGKINWDEFVKSDNCIELTRRASDGLYVGTIDTKVANFKIKVSFNTIKNVADDRIFIITTTSNANAYQRMILVNSAMQKVKKKVTIPTTITPPPPPPPPPPPACSIATNPTTGARIYYGTSSTAVDVYTYRNQCVHNCQYFNNTYYCRNADLDYSGPACTYEQWEEQCTYCGQNRKVCTANPDDPACPKDYWQDCPNCTPSADMPDSCNDFDANSEIEGKVNDLNEKKSACNFSEYPVKGCVIGGKDLAGNVYAMQEALKNNRYCRAYCIEDYKFEVPTARHSTSGGYFDLAMKITGTRNCYLGPPRDEVKKDKGVSSEMIDYRKFYNDLYNLNQNIIDSQATNNYSAVLNYSNELNKLVDEYKACTTVANKWVNNMIFDPKVDYTYDDYKNKYNKGTFSKIEETEETKVENTFCYGTTDGNYNCNGDKIVTDQDVPLEDSAYETYSYYSCTGTASYASCVLKQEKINKAIGVQKKVEKTAIFAPSQSFDTYHQYGTVITKANCLNTGIEGYKNCLWTRLPDAALPVELKTGKGAFPYTLKFRDVGQYADGSLGRLIGNDNSILNKFNELDESKKCLASDDPDDSTPKYSKYDQDVGYICSYINNCDECQASCDSESCKIKECEDCKVSCRTCIFDGTNTTYKYRTISLNNIFPNKCLEGASENSECRNEGYNWNAKNANTNGASKKAAVTIDEIEKDGEKAYEENKQYSYTLTPLQLSAIRQYNKDAGSYANTQMPHNEVFKDTKNALQCDQEKYDNGIQYSVRCLSTFLSDTSETYFTSNIPRSDTTKFTLWTETEYCIRGSCLSHTDGVGPSWK